MKFSKRCDSKFKPAFFVEDLQGKQISEYFTTFGDALREARTKSCFVRGGVRVNVCLSSFRVEGGRIISEV